MHLTPQQRVLTDYLIAYIGKHRYSPTYEEIARHFGYRSLSTVYEHLQKLAAKGIIRTERGRARSIEVVVEEDCGDTYQSVFPPSAWLCERCDEGPRCPLPEGADLPLTGVRRYRERWRMLKRAAQPDDELWTFCSPPESWKQSGGRAGFVLVRDGAVVDGLVAWDELADPDAAPGRSTGAN